MSSVSVVLEVTFADVTDVVMPRNSASTITPRTVQGVAARQVYDAMHISEVVRDTAAVDKLRALSTPRTHAKARDRRAAIIFINPAAWWESLLDSTFHYVRGAGWAAVMFQHPIMRVKHITSVIVPVCRGSDDLHVLEMFWSSTTANGLEVFSAIRSRIRARTERTVSELLLCSLLMCFRGSWDSIHQSIRSPVCYVIVQPMILDGHDRGFV